MAVIAAFILVGSNFFLPGIWNNEISPKLASN
jgi:hypothetical protein